MRVHRPSQKGGLAHPINVLSESVASSYYFMLTCAHSDDSSHSFRYKGSLVMSNENTTYARDGDKGACMRAVSSTNLATTSYDIRHCMTCSAFFFFRKK